MKFLDIATTMNRRSLASESTSDTLMMFPGTFRTSELAPTWNESRFTSSVILPEMQKMMMYPSKRKGYLNTLNAIKWNSMPDTSIAFLCF